MQYGRDSLIDDILKEARIKKAIDFPTEEAMKKYLHDHPEADPANHKVVKTEEKAPAKVPPTKKNLLKKIKDKTVELLDKATRPSPEDVESAFGVPAEKTREHYKKIDKGEMPRKLFMGVPGTPGA